MKPFWSEVALYFRLGCSRSHSNANMGGQAVESRKSSQFGFVARCRIDARAQMEKKALSKPFHAYKPRIYLLCLRMIGNAAEAKIDAGSVLQAVRKNQTFRGEPLFQHGCTASHEHLLMRASQTKIEKHFHGRCDEHDKEDRPERQYGSADLSLTGWRPRSLK